MKKTNIAGECCLSEVHCGHITMFTNCNHPTSHTHFQLLDDDDVELCVMQKNVVELYCVLG